MVKINDLINARWQAYRTCGKKVKKQPADQEVDENSEMQVEDGPLDNWQDQLLQGPRAMPTDAFERLA